jgi:hypothetical protein
VVLQNVAHDAGLFVERAATLDTEALRHRDLHAVDVVAIPDRFENAVGEAQHQDVLDRLFAEIVVDAVDLVLAQILEHLVIERFGAGEIAAERLFDDDAHGVGGSAGAGQSGLMQLLDDDAE